MTEQNKQNEGKPTPGPWYESKMGNDHQGLVVNEETGENIAVAYDKANAALIAAAPDLLEACERSLRPLQMAQNSILSAEAAGAFLACRDAIAKARGDK